MGTLDDRIEAIGADETKLIEVHKHWFGLAIVYFEAAIGFMAGLLLLWFVSPMLFANSDAATRRLYLSSIAGVVAALGWLILIVYTFIYRQNRLIITDKNLTQILQRGLFSRKISELSMANVEDVTANQHGLFASILGYGDLIVETAGEQANFNFSFCPNPNYAGKIVLDGREKFLHEPNHRRNR